MNTSLKKFISRFVHLSDGELDEITDKFRSKTIQKNNYLLKQVTCAKILYLFKRAACVRREVRETKGSLAF
jgi:hypothetical protein